MPASNLTELALRAAVNTTPKKLVLGQLPTNQIKDTALNRVKELVTANSTVSVMGKQIELQSLAIGVAVQGLEVAYSATMHQLEVLKNRRLAFDKERQAGIATFIVQTDVEERDLSQEEQIIKTYIDLAFRNKFFSPYLGIHTAELAGVQNASFYSVLPFYRMSEALDQPVASPKPLDRQRTAIGLFFKSALPDAMADIDMEFQTENKFFEFFKSTYKKENYLNDLRSPRFVMMSLANLLWNLQHPVDPVSGYPLSIDQCISTCREVEIFLNQLLNSQATPYIQEISNDENQLISFVRKIEIHTKALRAAYIEEQLHELNIADVTNSAHHALRIMDINVFKLVYQRANPLSKKKIPDEKAAEELAYTVSYFNQLLVRNPKLLQSFNLFLKFVPASACLNLPPTTVIDALGIFCHLAHTEREALLATLDKSTLDSNLEFAQTLRKFYIKFVKPIKDICKKEVADRQKVAVLTARRLMPLITLVLEDYRIEVDTEHSYSLAKQSKGTGSELFSGKEQVKIINKMAEKGGDYYMWALSPFVKLSVDSARQLDMLPTHQYRMTQMTELLDSVSEIVQNYRSFLQSSLFQQFLLTCLNKVKEEYAELDRHIELVDNFLSKDESMSRSMQAILRPMMGELNSSLAAFDTATRNFEYVVGAPDFSDKQKQLLSAKIAGIHQQFTGLFKEDSGISTLGAEILPDESSNTRPAPAASVEARKVLALRKLVQGCLDSLSYLSRYGHKGDLLENLLAMIDRKPNFTDAQIKEVILELIHVSASYRQTSFFQAEYGQSRSAQYLIAAVKDPDIKRNLPLAELIFNREVAVMQLTDTDVISGLNTLREENDWEESASEISRVALC